MSFLYIARKAGKDLFSNIYFHYHFCLHILFLFILFSTLFLSNLSNDCYLFKFVYNNYSILDIGENDYKDFFEFRKLTLEGVIHFICTYVGQLWLNLSYSHRFYVKMLSSLSLYQNLAWWTTK